MRLPVEILVVICLAVGIVPALTIGPYLRTAAVVGARRRAPRTTASRSGTGSTRRW